MYPTLFFTWMFIFKRSNITGHLGKGKVFNNIDQEFRSVAVVGVGREGAGFNELEMLDEGMVSEIYFMLPETSS